MVIMCRSENLIFFIFSDGMTISINLELSFIYISYLMTHIVLGYWKVRGLAQPLRHLLAYTGLEFE